MILDRSGTRVISSVGWVDHGSLWLYDSLARTTSRAHISDADYLSLVEGADGFFALVHHWQGQAIRITAHDSADPTGILAAIDVADWVPRMSGDSQVWRKLPRVFVSYLNLAAHGAHGYFLISVSPDRTTVRRVDWFDADTYDLDYQGVISVAALEGSDELVFGVQRSSDLVLWDIEQGTVTRRVPLADRGGNPSVQIINVSEAWVIDYDTVVKLDPNGWSITGCRLMQPPDEDGRRMFVGSLSIDRDGMSVLVPRPGQGDVCILRRSDLELLDCVDVGRQPLVATRTANGAMVARDWKTGDLLMGPER